MKLKKIYAIVSLSTLGLTISACTADKNDTVAPQNETGTQSQQTINSTQNNKATASGAIDNATQKQPSEKVTKPKKIELIMDSNASYTVGYQVGSGIAKQDFGLYDKQTIAGFEDAVKGNKPRISESQIRRNMDSLKDKMIKKQLDIAKENEKKSEEFMSQVAKMSNAIKVNDGVYYQMLKQGDGKKPNENSQVTIAYKGTTPVIAYEDDKAKLNDIKDGKKLIGPIFDSSKNATFPLTNLIQCWKDAIPKIPAGSTFILYCAPNKAYSDRAPATIGPNQALSFKITLKEFK